MKACWVDAGNLPNVTKLQAVGVTRPYFAMNDPQVNKTMLGRWRATPPFDSVGVYVVASWYPTTDTPEQFAERIDAWLNEVMPGTGSTFPYIMVDIEYPNRALYVPRFLAKWRQLRPQRMTDWTMEGFQGGWIMDISGEVTAANVGLYPQCYDGQMHHYAEDAVRDDLTGTGPSVACVYDAALFHPETRWNEGVLFTQGRLP